MKLKKNLSLIAFLCISFIANAQQKLSSPDGNLEMTFTLDGQGTPKMCIRDSALITLA